MKKILFVAVLVIALGALASCSKDGHTHKYDEGVVTTDALCGAEKTVKYTCKECTYSYTKIIAVEHDWKKADCNNAKTCSICNAVEGAPLGHSYEDNVCKRCNSSLSIDLTLPPVTDTNHVTVKNYFNGAVASEFKITSLSATYSATTDSNVTITFTISGEKTADAKSENASKTASLIYKLYDDAGAVVASGTFTTPHLCVGEFFMNKEFSVYGLKNGEKYTLVLADYYN